MYVYIYRERGREDEYLELAGCTLYEICAGMSIYMCVYIQRERERGGVSRVSRLHPLPHMRRHIYICMCIYTEREREREDEYLELAGCTLYHICEREYKYMYIYIVERERESINICTYI